MTFTRGAQSRTPQTAERDGTTRHFGVDWRLAIFLTLAIISYWTDVLRILFPGQDSAPSLLFRAFNFGLYGIFAVLLAQHVSDVFARVKQSPLLVMFLALPALSYVWSTMPDETLQRTIAVTGSTLLGVYMAIVLTPRHAVRLTAFASFLAGIGSLAIIAAMPSIGIMAVEHPGAWAGLYGHKNSLGAMAALGALLALAILLTEGLSRHMWALISVALNVVLVLGSRSFTAVLLLVFVSLALIFVGRFVRFIVDNAALFALLVVPPALLAIAFFDSDTILTLLEAAGKSGNLSDRLPMWQTLWPFMTERLWLGWGFDAFWHGANYALRVVEAKLKFRPYYAHNGIVELWLSLGLVGVAVFLVLYGQLLRRTLRALYRDGPRMETMAAFAFTVIFVLQNFSESTILMRHSMSWVLFVMFYLMLSQRSALPYLSAGEPYSHVQTGLSPPQPRKPFARRSKRPAIAIE